MKKQGKEFQEMVDRITTAAVLRELQRSVEKFSKDLKGMEEAYNLAVKNDSKEIDIPDLGDYNDILCFLNQYNEKITKVEIEEPKEQKSL